MQERPLPQSDVGSLPPLKKTSEHRSSVRPYITRSDSAYGNMRHTSGSAYPSMGGYACSPSTGGYADPRADPRLDPRDLRMNPRDSRMDPRMDPRATGSNMYPSRGSMPSYPPGMSLPIDVSMQGVSDDPRSHDYASSLPTLQSGRGPPYQSSREMPFQSDRLGSFYPPSGIVPSAYPPQGPYQMRHTGKAQFLREEQRPPANLNLDPRDPSNNYTDLVGLTSQEEREVTESRPVLDTTKSRTLNELGETLISKPVGERAHRTSAPILHSNADEPHSSMENPNANHDQETEWSGIVSQCFHNIHVSMFLCSS